MLRVLDATQATPGADTPPPLPASIAFRKLHGLGNDYLFIAAEAVAAPWLPLLARSLSDRHFGVGADGLIAVTASAGGISMRMFNADGSEGRMCGNGVRGAVRFAIEEGIATGPRVRVETASGVVEAMVHPGADGAFEVEVAMGRPILESALIPLRLPGLEAADAAVGMPIERLAMGEAWGAWGAWAPAAGATGRWSAVSMGNPHLVLECSDPGLVPLEQVGPVLERLPCFPDRVNVHFAAVRSRSEVEMRTWERGSGITLACGSGACAVFAALRRLGELDPVAAVHLPGGSLRIEESADGGIRMRGEAEAVFGGCVDPQPILRRLGLDGARP
jgi:diaminopimelate epimerase